MKILLAMLALMAGALAAEPDAAFDASKEQALREYPALKDQTSAHAREANRLVAFYEAKKDPLLAQDDSPMIIAQAALVNITTDWRKLALEKWPGLGIAGHPLNKAVIARYSADPAIRENPQWPLLLADECAAKLGKAAEVAEKPRAQIPPITFKVEEPQATSDFEARRLAALRAAEERDATKAAEMAKIKEGIERDALRNAVEDTRQMAYDIQAALILQGVAIRRELQNQEQQRWINSQRLLQEVRRKP